ncbi:MAG TPA: GNAT family N-acetyltransferase [Caulobacteraceae bacterium]|nr:GNAT family N-acetyltransferase [Caulobacteraceae bacterium]
MPLFDQRRLEPSDAAEVLALHVAVASMPDSGLARAPDEMQLAYFADLLADPAAQAFGAFAEGRLIGEIHASRMKGRQFSHVMTDLTVAVAPEFQGRGVGIALFERLFAESRQLEPAVTRIELISRSGNAGAIRLYQRLGFAVEGCFRGRVRLPNGEVEDDIPMAKAL